VAGLQGRIAIEQANINIQNEQTKLQMYALIADEDNSLQEQREYDLAMKDAAKRGGLNVQPMQFSNKH
jgi:type IV secretion system protein VirB5